jgi:hypothetical protein
VQGDRDSLVLALDALIENAVDHTPMDGHIELSVHRDGASVVVVAAYSGSGIPAAELERIFDRFSRTYSPFEIASSLDPQSTRGELRCRGLRAGSGDSRRTLPHGDSRGPRSRAPAGAPGHADHPPLAGDPARAVVAASHRVLGHVS